ncbi:hypothetical protein [Brevundimonas sp. FT23042]|uniref:hypothetical protein n=1 Tax=Brevundimonas sp. FT23042 TaxID=3393749 RepID=UPI003B588FEA
MTSVLSLTKSALPVLVLLLCMGVSPLLIEPAYIGYIAAYGIFIVLSAKQILTPDPEPRRPNRLLLGWVAFAGLVLMVTLLAKPGFRDLVRDGGAAASFLFGLFLIPRALGPNWERPLFAALSALAMIVAVWTIFGAARAYFAGVGAYEWRGLYVPFVHTWLPYLIVAEYIRSRSGADIRLSAFRIGLCVLALLLSLSRTGLGLILVFGAVTLMFNARRWLLTGRGIALMVTAAVASALILPQLLQLDVVQQRIQVGIGSNDQSLGWRAMEQMAAVNYLDAGGLWRWLFGYGLGSQMPLPVGIVDFAGNPTVPHLHNSYWTYVFKFGLIGTAWIMLSIAVLVVRAHLSRGGVPALLVGGSWIVALVMGTALTLQGMSEWSHLMFLGIACAMLSKAARSPRLARRPTPNRTIMANGSGFPAQSQSSWPR